MDERVKEEFRNNSSEEDSEAGAQKSSQQDQLQVTRQPSSSNIVNLTQAQLHQQFYKQYPRDNLQSRPADALICLSGSVPDEEHSSYWSDSTVSNCDRDTSQNQSTEGNHESRGSGTDGSGAQLRATGDQLKTKKAGQRRCNNNSGPARVVRKRVMANERERERTKSLNQALEILRNRLPIAETHKRSKIQTLRLAKDYIEFLFAESGSVISQSQHQSSSYSGDGNQRFAGGAPPQQIRQYSSCDSTGDHKLHQPGAIQTSNVPAATACAGRQQPDSPLDYKFYKFRLKKQTRPD